jgi:flagellar hook-associated protein 1 FlgK
MALMANLYVGTSGLQVAQNALNTTAHNMSNIDTDGYTRQQVSQGTRSYSTLSKSNAAVSWEQIGLGVNYNNCKQVRSTFLDASYRLENGRSGFYDVSYSTINEVEDQLQEMNGAEFADTLSNLWTSVQELAKDPTSAVNQSTFVTRCNEFTERAQAVYKGLTSYQSNLNDNVSTLVDQINNYGDQISELNEKIVGIECGGVEHANDLRDTRNQLLDKLGELGNISYEEDIFGNVLVSFEGTQFVATDHVNHMACDTSESSCQYNTPYWEFAAKTVTAADGTTSTDISGAHVYDLTQTVSTDMNTDVGKLRSTLLARGDHNATYHDIQDDSTGTYYNKNIAQSVIMNNEAEFDQLCNSVYTAINSVLQSSASNPATLAGKGNTTDYWMFTQTDPASTLNYAIGSNAAGSTSTGFTVMNTQINSLLLQQPTLNTFKTADGSEDTAAATALKTAFTTSKYTLNPNVATTTTLQNYYSSLVSQIANSGTVSKSIADNQNTTVTTISNAREQIIGTSSDEEIQFMIEFQNAYNASSRYINVVSEMLEHIVTTLGS